MHNLKLKIGNLLLRTGLTITNKKLIIVKASDLMLCMAMQLISGNPDVDLILIMAFAFAVGLSEYFALYIYIVHHIL